MTLPTSDTGWPCPERGESVWAVHFMTSESLEVDLLIGADGKPYEGQCLNEILEDANPSPR